MLGRLLLLVFFLLERIKHTVSAFAGRRRGRCCHRSRIQNRAGTIFHFSNQAETDRGREEDDCENCGRASQDVRRASAAHEAAASAAAAHSERAAFGALQKYDADKGDHNHEVDDDQDGLHELFLLFDVTAGLYTFAVRI